MELPQGYHMNYLAEFVPGQRPYLALLQNVSHLF